MVEPTITLLEIPSRDEEELEPLEMAPPCMSLLCFQWLAWKCGCLNLDEKKDPVQLNRGESVDVRDLAKGIN